MAALYLVLLVLAAVFLAIASVWGWGWRTVSGNPAGPPWGNFIALGLLCWELVALIAKARSM